MEIKNIKDAFQMLLGLDGLIANLEITFDVDDDGVITCRMPIKRLHVGSPGRAHGGAIMTLLDTALGMHASRHAMEQGQATSTVEIKINYLRPVMQGRTLITETTTESVGRTLMVVSGRALDEASGESVAFAVGTFNLYQVNPQKLAAQLKALQGAPPE